jgi:hypothetical protein
VVWILSLAKDLSMKLASMEDQSENSNEGEHTRESDNSSDASGSSLLSSASLTKLGHMAEARRSRASRREDALFRSVDLCLDVVLSVEPHNDEVGCVRLSLELSSSRALYLFFGTLLNSETLETSLL